MTRSTKPNLPSNSQEPENRSVDEAGRMDFNAAANWAPFWKPRFVASSDALVHVPYLFWLVQSLLPQRIAQLGISDGVAYLGICQMVEKLGLSASCRGITIEGVNDASKDAIAHNERHYSDFSSLSVERLSNAHRHFRSGNIDLLIVNTPLDASAAKALKEKWTGKLSKRGVVVVLNSRSRLNEEGSAGWLNPLLDDCPAIELDQGGGLLTLLIGADPVDRIARLAAFELGMPGYREARQMFGTLGDSLACSREVLDLRAVQKKHVANLERAHDQLSKVQGELTKARSGEDNAQTQLAVVQAHSFDLKAKVEHLETALTNERDVVAKLRANSTTLEAKVTELEAALSNERDAVTNLRSHSTSLEAKVEELEAELTIKRESAAILKTELSEQHAASLELAAKTKELASAKHEYRERLIDISELGHGIAEKEKALSQRDREIEQWRKRAEESELRSQIVMQLAVMRGELQAGLAQKPKRGRVNATVQKVEEEITLVRASNQFDPEWYLAFYPDVAEAGEDPAHHFVTNGAYELRHPGPSFDSFKYHTAFPDVAKAGLAAFIHFVRYGYAENRETFPVGERR